MRLAVVDEQPLLQVLTSVGEAQCRELGVAARRAVGNGRADPHQVAAQRDRRGAQGGVAAEREVVGAHVHGVVGPFLGDEQREPRPLGQHDLEVVGQRAGTALHEDDRRLGVRGGAQL